MNTFDCPFRLLLVAEVSRTWYDDDGYGNTDSDYLTMTLRIPTWPPDQDLRARIQVADTATPPVVKGKRYKFSGGYYFRTPQLSWHRAFMCIDSYSEILEASEEYFSESPRFDVICGISSVNGDILNLSWRTWDDYENATCGQTATVLFEGAGSSIKDYPNGVFQLTGFMVDSNDLRGRGLGVF